MSRTSLDTRIAMAVKPAVMFIVVRRHGGCPECAAQHNAGEHGPRLLTT
jgi:hypothetical protein